MDSIYLDDPPRESQPPKSDRCNAVAATAAGRPFASQTLEGSVVVGLLGCGGSERQVNAQERRLQNMKSSSLYY
jgi:hypothetical protein